MYAGKIECKIDIYLYSSDAGRPTKGERMLFMTFSKKLISKLLSTHLAGYFTCSIEFITITFFFASSNFVTYGSKSTTSSNSELIACNWSSN